MGLRPSKVRRILCGQAYYSLGLLLAEIERLEEAIKFLDKAASLLPEQSRIFYNLAIAHQTLENQESAETAYQRAIELAPGNGDYRYGLTTLYLQEGRNQMALEQVQELSRIYPDNPQVK